MCVLLQTAFISINNNHFAIFQRSFCHCCASSSLPFYDYGSEKKLERLKAAIKSGNTEIIAKESEYKVISDLSNGQTNQKLFDKLIRDIPKDVELDRVIIRDNTFQIYGNSVNVTSVNNFYNTFMKDQDFANIKIDSFRRKDRAMNFFELVGVIEI